MFFLSGCLRLVQLYTYLEGLEILLGLGESATNDFGLLIEVINDSAHENDSYIYAPGRLLDLVGLWLEHYH